MEKKIRLTISEEKVGKVLAACALQEGSTSFNTLYVGLNNFIENDLQEINEVLYRLYYKKGIRPQGYTLERAFGKKHPYYVAYGNNTYLENLLDYYIEKYKPDFKTKELGSEVAYDISVNASIHDAINDVIKNDDFLNSIYHSLSAPLFHEIASSSQEAINSYEAGLFFRFIKSLYNTYAREQLFTSLIMVADQGSIMGRLLMKDYFIQISYVTQTEIKTKESIIRNETELNTIKIRRSIESNQQLTKDYIINFSLKNLKNLLVLGNPGVGKSTFGRWLCHMWSQNPMVVDNIIPVYIQLKGLEFGINENSITNYIYRNYLINDKSEQKDLHGLLRKIPSFVCFILDGYDELSEDQKEKLYNHLQEISSNCKYILTSRPYGILKTYGLKWDQLIQLDGFDISNMHNYIDVFLLKNDVPNKTKEELLDIINLNPTLTDFAHNPLMLSFIVYIYLSDHNAIDTFKNIQTRFDLQQVVISWMLTHNKSKISTTLDNKLIESAAIMACAMELDKTPEKKGHQHDEEVTSVLLPLSQLGIGQYVGNDMGLYKFYFNSITFQEYFASIEVAKRISSHGMEYILQDSYFWNLTAMIIGQLNSASTSVIMDRLLDTCEEELAEGEKDYSYYKYVLLLSECRRDYLNSKLTDKALQTINKAFAQNNKNAKLKYAVAECVQRIYNKANIDNQRAFKEILLKNLEMSWANPSDKLLKYDASCKHLPTLVKYLDLNLDYGFIKKCVELLITALSDLKEGVADFSAAWDLPDFVLAIIQNNDEDFFQIGKPYLETIIPYLPTYFINCRGKIQLHYVDAKMALSTLVRNIRLYKKGIEIQEKERLIGEIAVYMFILGKKSIELTLQVDVSKCQLALSNGAKIIHEYLKNRNEDDYSIGYIDGPRPIAQLTSEGLFESKEYENNYPEAIAILAAIDDEYLFFDQIIQLSLHNYFEAIINKALSVPSDDQIQEICTMIYCIPALKNKIAFHRDKIFDLINAYIDNNRVVFQDVNAESKIDYFLRLLAREEDAINESDRRFFIEKMIKNDKGKLPYFKIIFFPKVIAKYMVIYHPLHWDFILSYLDENSESSIKTALIMYSNASIYLYATNLPNIQKLLSFLQRLQTKTFYDTFIIAQAEHILTIISQVLMMLKQTNIISYQVRNQLTFLAGELLIQDQIKGELKDNLGKYRVLAAGYAAYILQYYFSNDSAFNLNINYWIELQKNNQRKMLVEYLYSAFVRHGTLPEKEVDKIKEVTGPEFIAELYNYHEQMKVFHFPFLKEQFISLCS